MNFKKNFRPSIRGGLFWLKYFNYKSLKQDEKG